jgi:hypothetical protein
MERRNLIKEIQRLCDLAHKKYDETTNAGIRLDTFSSWKVLEVVLKENEMFKETYTDELLKQIIDDYSWINKFY